MRVRGGVVALLGVLCMSCAGTTVRFIEPQPRVVCEPARTPGSLVVRVLDPYGTPVPGIAVALLEPSGDVKRRLVTSPDGVVTFRELPSSGACTVQSAHPGFETTIAKDVSCPASCETTVELPMEFDGDGVIV